MDLGVAAVSGRAEEEILRLEREYWQLPDYRALQVRLVALEQQLAASWMYWPAGATLPPNTSFSGVINGCPNGFTARPLAGATVSIVFPSGTWTGVTDGSGAYSGSAYLAANGSISMTVTPANTTRQATLTTTTGTLIAGGSNTIAAKQVLPASGYSCTDLCMLPVKNTIQFTDHENSDVRTWTFSGSSWTGLTVFGAGSFQPNGVLNLPSGGGAEQATRGTTVCPDSPSFSIHYTHPFPALGSHWSNTATFDLVEL
jgi:hypothetical protein